MAAFTQRESHTADRLSAALQNRFASKRTKRHLGFFVMDRSTPDDVAHCIACLATRTLDLCAPFLNSSRL